MNVFVGALFRCSDWTLVMLTRLCSVKTWMALSGHVGLFCSNIIFHYLFNAQKGLIMQYIQVFL
jgi:hypothetical protein